MPIKVYKPTSAGRRDMTGYTFEEITKSKPERSLTTPLRIKGGRNNSGRVTVRHRGGGHKRRYRIIDFKRNKFDSRAEVIAIEYDPNRSARIALVQYEDGEKRYIIAPLGMKVGQFIANGENAELRPGNAAQMVRAAGTSAQVIAKEGNYVTLRLPSGEYRKVLEGCMATIGQVGNAEHGNVNLGKAGRSRWLGWRPTVRGTAQDPASHPHGGGEGRSGIGMKAPKTPWGKPALGVRTRKNKRTDAFIVRRRGKRR